jgi:hypothetical protein
LAIYDRPLPLPTPPPTLPTPTSKTALDAWLRRSYAAMQSHTIAVNQFALVQYAASVGGVWRSPGGAYSRSYPGVNASKAPLSRIFLRAFLRLFSPGFAADLAAWR